MTDSGVYTRAQLRSRGLSDTDIRRMVAGGTLDRLRSGWFAIGAHDRDAAAAVRDGGVLTCVSALRFHGLWIPPGHAELHLRRSRHKSGRRVACRPIQGTLRGTSDAVDSVPVALTYAARCLPADEWIAVCDSHLNSAASTPGNLLSEMKNVGPTVLGLLQRTDPQSQSGTESIARVRLRAAGYRVVVQPQIPRVGRADLRIGRLILECDSLQHHTSRTDYERDHHRDRRALVDGWLTMRLTYDDVIYGWPSVLADIQSISRSGRHRARTTQQKELLQKSAPSSTAAGNMPA